MHFDMAVRLAMADVASTVYYNRKHKLLGDFEPGCIFIIKNRQNMVFDLPFIGPLRFVGYKNTTKTAAVVEDKEGY